MTTNQQIDKIIACLYNYQVKQNRELSQLPNYDVLCREIFVDIPGLSERHYQNLLYMLNSKRLINTHVDAPEQAYHNPISLRPEVIVWYEQFHSYLDYLDYLEEKNQPKAFKENYDEDIDSEVEERKSIWGSMPVWLKIVLLMAVIIGVVIVATGINGTS